MSQKIVGTNTLYFDITCPYCGRESRSGIGFRAGVVHQLSYHLGQRLDWNGPNCSPSARPPGGNMKTIGYFNCDNPRCETWQDCFPEVQEALIVIVNDFITECSVVKHHPEKQDFPILEPEGIE